MDFRALGRLAEQATRRAINAIRDEQRAGSYVVEFKDDPYTLAGKSLFVPVDVRAQRVYTDLFVAKTPEIGIVVEEKDHLLKAVSRNGQPNWVIDGLDGTNLFAERALFGYGTQCALLLPDGTVPIAFVGDATTSEIFGYYGDSGVFRIDKNGKRSKIQDIVREEPLPKLKGMRRPSIDMYHPLCRRILCSGKARKIDELCGGIGTTMAQLLTDKIGLFALRPHHEKPWDAIPAYALCAEAGMAFMTPSPDGRGLVEWKPRHVLRIYKREFDLLVVHRTRVAELQAVARAVSR